MMRLFSLWAFQNEIEQRTFDEIKTGRHTFPSFSYSEKEGKNK